VTESSRGPSIENPSEVADYEPAVVAIHEIREATPAHVESAMTPAINDQASSDCLGLNLDALSYG
jgi:hypothetical protein